MRIFIYPTKDTTIYQRFPTNNAGLDEILEVGKVLESGDFDTAYTGSAARSLLYFTLPSTASVSTASAYYLNLKIAYAENLTKPQTLEVVPISSSWEEGTGYFYQTPNNENTGATWRQTDTHVSWSSAGGDLNATTTQSVQLTTYPLTDIRLNVTTIFQSLVNSGSAYNGIAIKFPSSDEQNRYNKGVVRLFSSQTHTIHKPYLEVAWDEADYSTGSFSPLPSSGYTVAAKNLLPEYYMGEVVRVDLVARDKFPNRTFESTLRYKNKYYLPTSSYYSVRDVQANVTVIPFDEYSRLEADATGPYFVMDTTQLQQGRYYTVQFKIETGSRVSIVPTNLNFKIV